MAPCKFITMIILKNTEQPNDGEQLLTTEELAARLKISAEWVLQQVRTGRIPAIKFNRRTFRFHWLTVLTAIQRL